jgi:uncharacterized protein YoxC
MNKEEYERLQENVVASGQTQQSFIINALAGVIIAPREEIDVLKNINKNFDDLLRQIRGMATNVNQMAHIANGTGVLQTIDALENIADQIKYFKKECEEMWQSIRRLISQQNHMGQ